MSSYVQFYRGERPTIFEPMFIDDLLYSATDDKLEKHHGYIQWVFPLKEASKSQPRAIDELLTDAAIAEMLGDKDITRKIKRMARRMLTFWGIGMTKDGATIKDEAVFCRKLGCVSNHNQLRMTRMLKFMRHLGWDEVVDELKQLLLSNTPARSKAVEHWTLV